MDARKEGRDSCTRGEGQTHARGRETGAHEGKDDARKRRYIWAAEMDAPVDAMRQKHVDRKRKTHYQE